LGFATDDFASYPSGSFFETVTYKGAFGNTLWLANWTALDAYGFLGSNGGNTNGTPRLPDLRFSTTNQASLPDEIGISDSLTFTFTIQNAGDFPSEGTRVRIRQGNQELLSETVSFLEVGGNVAFSFKVLGTDLGLGSHVLTVEIDPDQEIREQNESNNSFSHTVQVVDDTPTFPDIVLTNLQVSANTAFVEQSLLLTFDIANLGDAISETVSITVTLGGESLTPTPGTLPALTIGESRSSSVEVTIPPGTTLGEKVLTLTLSEPNETNTTNNTGTVNVEIIERPPTGPDLTINSISVDSSQICRGNILMVMMEIENIGDENAGNFLIGVTLGDNPISPDPSLFTAGVAAGSSQTFNTALVIPANEPVGTSQLIITLFLNADIEPGNNSDSISITIKNCDQEPPTCDFTLTEASDLFHSVGQGATSQPSIQVSDVSQVEQVNFLYRHISSFDEIFTVQPLTSNGNTYTASLSDSDFGPVGISYRFQVLATGCEDKVESGHIYLSYSDPGLSLPSIPAGSAQPDYRMIAVPLSLNSRGFLDTFGDELQDDEGKTRWRFMRFNGSSTIDHTGTIDPGLGYWILSTSPLSLQTDAGTTVQVTEDSPFSFNLTSGGTFTQIGNPYNFPVSWEDVLTENATSRSLVKLLTYSRGWDSLEVLSPFQGAFIQNNAGLSRIQVPVKRNPNVNRLAAGEPLPALDAENWKVGIELKTQDLVHKVSAFGMHSKAIEGRDALDMQGLPRFSTFLDLNFPLEDSPNKSFRENYVNTQDSYTWNMEVQSSDKGVIEVSWENAYFGNNTKELWLENLQTGQVIDMRLKKTAYVRSSGQENVFRIHFGPLEYVQAQIQQSTPWIGEPFPNPFTNKLAFELFIPNSGGKAKVEGELFNLIGQKVTEKVWHLDSNHPNQLLKWDVSSQLHTKGVYLYKLRVSSNFISQDKIGSVIFIE
ncbi:MAG: CARDB domain-containing protein, partial [Bacteroidota bacterium]